MHQIHEKEKEKEKEKHVGQIPLHQKLETPRTRIKNRFGSARARGWLAGRKFNKSVEHNQLAGKLLLLVGLLLSTQPTQSSPSEIGESLAAPASQAAEHHPQGQVRVSSDAAASGAGPHLQDAEHHHEQPLPARPPRGYCARISRAIKPTSRCYKHLVQDGDGSPHHHDDAQRAQAIAGTTTTGQEEEEEAAAAAAAASTGTSVHSNSNGDHRGNKFRAAPPTARAETISIDAANQNHERTRRRRRGASNNHEELVYVRSETLGDKITNLNTQAINEHLIEGLLARLMYGGAASETANSRASPLEDEDEEEIRMHIMGSSASASSSSVDELWRAKRCQLAVERFLCRLVYPTCHFRPVDVGALVRPPCREDCLLLREELCPNMDWRKFVRATQRAFNTTLMSTINALDLVVDGDPKAASELLKTGSGKALSLATLAERRKTQFEAEENRAGRAEHQQEGPEQEHSSKPLHKWPLPAGPSGYDLSSSLHLYWPHERSIEHCDSLPPLRPLLVSHTGRSQAATVYVDLKTISPQRDQSVNREPRKESSHRQAFRSWTTAHSQAEPHPHGRHQAREWSICSNARLTESHPIEPADLWPAVESPGHGPSKQSPASASKQAAHGNCLTSANGADYFGTQNVTRSGLLCQPWIEQQPHKHKRTLLLFDNMRQPSRYCRNPGGLDANGPYCFTTDKDVRWEHCQIAKC